MKIVILGAGRRGLRLASILAAENNDIIVIDTNEKKTDMAMARIDCIAFPGNGINLKDLEEDRVRGADAFVAITGSDEINLISAAMVSDEFKVPQTICIVKNLSFLGYKTNEDNSLLGIKHIINPDQELAAHIYTEIVQGVFRNTISFQNSELMLYTLALKENSEYNDMTIQDFRKTLKQNFVVAAIARHNTSLVPSGTTKLKSKDLLTIVANPSDSSKIFSGIGSPKTKAKKIAIVGATQTTRFLLEKFSSKERHNIILIDRDVELCESFAESFPEILVVNGNITDEEMFKESNLLTSDLFIAITDSDELNIIVASYAKQVGISYSMALIKSNTNYLRMAKHLDIDDIISTQKVAVDSIARYLHGKNVNNIHSLFDGQMESIEFKIPDNSPALNKQLKELNMKGKGIIAGIIKNNGKSVIPDGTYTLQKGDLLIVITTLNALNNILRILQ